jgi:hypothetical protein
VGAGPAGMLFAMVSGCWGLLKDLLELLRSKKALLDYISRVFLLVYKEILAMRVKKVCFTYL